MKVLIIDGFKEQLNDDLSPTQQDEIKNQFHFNVIRDGNQSLFCEEHTAWIHHGWIDR
jgi:hypothetical protein